jgi:1-acyl-sn-glycerol-3-phosphate acyltransferase
MHNNEYRSGYRKILPPLRAVDTNRIVSLQGTGSVCLAAIRLTLCMIWIALITATQTIALRFFKKLSLRIPGIFHRICCRIMGLKVVKTGKCEESRQVMYVINHLSYTDISVIGGLVDGCFVAKKEIKSWPVFGYMTRLQRSIFVERKRENANKQRLELLDTLADGDNLIIFPEGTSTDGSRVLPFKSSLFSSVYDTDKDVIVQPISLAYTHLNGVPIGRAWRPAFNWFGDVDMLPHMWRLLGLGTVTARVHFHEPLDPKDYGNRKALAKASYEAVSEKVSDFVCHKE